MKFNDLQISSHKSGKRVGRGIAAGQGKTAGRGTKGQKSRTGSSKKPGFEGGQNPLMQRLPKLHGFKSKRAPTENVSTGQIKDIKSKVIDSVVLAENGLVSSSYVKVKLLYDGELSKALTVRLQGASTKAVDALEKSGGSFEIVERLGRDKKPKEKEETPKK